MRPTVGRMVHYVNLGDKDGKYPPQVQAAVITGIYEEREYHSEDGKSGTGLERVNDGVGTPAMKISTYVDLKVFYKTGLFDCEKIPMREAERQRGCWDWPTKI